MLALTGLTEFARAWPRQLSGGMRQRVGIARALAVRPACLLMDEPLSALDAQTRDLLLDEFAALIERAGTTTVYVTHNLAEAVRLGQQIVVLSRRPGRVRDVLRIDRPLRRARRRAIRTCCAVEAALWRMIRDDAAAAEREIEHAAALTIRCRSAAAASRRATTRWAGAATLLGLVALWQLGASARR